MKTTALHIDCMEYMATLEDNAFELAVVDPEFENGTNADKGTGGYSRRWLKGAKKDWDKKRAGEDYFEELQRVSVNQIIWGGQFFASLLPVSRGWICWYKTDEVKGRDFSEFELAYASFRRPTRHFSHRPFIRNGARIHPTQKPTALYRWLLANYAKPGDRILDTHLGSGSSRIAAEEMGFEFVGCELDQEYFEAQEKRFNQWYSQGNLFREESLKPLYKQGSIFEK